MTGILLHDVEVDGRRCAVRVRQGRVHELAPQLRMQRGELTIDGRGGALIPGLHDHHFHILASAAARSSVRCGPPDVSEAEGLKQALRSAPSGSWVRGIAYAESVAGPLDRWLLDTMVPDRPVRVQHRGGALWVVNSAGLHALGLDGVHDPDVERDATGALAGRLWRYDTRLRARIGSEPPDLADLGAELRALGITGLTDATPDLDEASCQLLSTAASDGVLPARILLLGAGDAWPGAGPRKLLLRDHDLPALEDITATIRHAHSGGRPVAVHVVTRTALILTLAALQEAGTLPGDRLEHGSVIPPDAVPLIRQLGLRVVTQPSFVRDRGDDYLRDVEPDDRDHLYPYARLLAAGVPVAPSSDAPFGNLDPWTAMQAAATRTTHSGVPLGTAERVPTRAVLAGYLSPAGNPGGPPRRVTVGAAADLCLLHLPLKEALQRPSRELVRQVLAGT